MNKTKRMNNYIRIGLVIISILPLFSLKVTNASDFSELAKWSMDETSGDVVFDQIKNNDGNISGAKRVPSLKKNGLLFDGVDDSLVIKNNGIFNVKNDMAFSIWVKATEQKTSKIFEKGDWDGHGLGQDIYKGWFVHFTFSDQTVKFDWGKGKPELNKWYHLYGAYNGKKIVFYVNGELVGEQKISGNLKNAKRDIIIGSDIDQKYFSGELDEARIIGADLSEEEIKNLYNYDYPAFEIPKFKIISINEELVPIADPEINLITEGSDGTKDVSIYKKDKRIFKSKVNIQTDLDWSDVDADMDSANGKSFFHIPETHTEIDSIKTLYIPAVNYSGEVYICPEVLSLDDVKPGCKNGYSLNGLTPINGYYEVEVTGTGGAEQGDISLSIYNSNESITSQPNTDITFYAEYKKISTNDPIDNNEGNCTISIPSLSVANEAMTYQSSGPYWSYVQVGGFSTTSIKNWSVSCTSDSFEDLNANDDINIYNINMVPEFKTYLLILTALLGLLFVFHQRRKAENN